MISILGLAADLLCFTLLINELNIFQASLIGSTVGMTVTHIVSSRPVFKKGSNVYTVLLALLFAIISNLLFALILTGAVENLGLVPFMARMGILPFSFSVNYLGNRFIVSLRGSL
jgi:putative flippase GtrA